MGRGGFETIEFPPYSFPGNQGASCRAGRRHFLSALCVSIQLNYPSSFTLSKIPMQRPSSGRFIENAARVRLIAEPGQAFFLALLSLRRAIVLSAVILLPAMALQADDSKVRLLDSTKNVKQLTAETVREIFFMRLSTWPDGSPIHVFVLPDNHPLHIRFAKEILGVYPFQLRSAWDRLVFSGTGVSPTTVETEEEMLERIKSTPGSIGYTDEKQGDH